MTDKKQRILIIRWDGTPPLSPGNKAFGHVNFSFHYLHEDGTPRNFNNDRYEIQEQGDAMADLQMRSQVALEHGVVIRCKDLYGWDVEYSRPFAVDLYKSRGMTKTLNKIHRSLDRKREKYDYPENYAVFVQRVAYCMKVTAVLEETGKALASDGYNRRTYRTHDVGDLRYLIDNTIRRHTDVQD